MASPKHIHTLKHTHSHIPLVHFTHMVNKKFIILMGLQWGEGDTGNSIWLIYPSCCKQMYLSCRYSIWTVGAGDLDAKKKKTGLT